VFSLGVVMMAIALATVAMRGLATSGDNPDAAAASSIVSGATFETAAAPAAGSTASDSPAPSSSASSSPSPAPPTYSTS
jgi:hypothetical protein